MKSLMLLLRFVLMDLGTRCDVSTDRDLKTITARIKHEGLSYLTIALPNFAKDLQKGLAQGYVDLDSFPGYRRRGELPVFLGGFLDLVFDRGDGRLLDDPSIDAIYSIRQLTMLFGKLEGLCTPEREQKAIDDYIECERQVKSADARRTSASLKEFGVASAKLLGVALQAVEHDVRDMQLKPKHGPGSTADRILGNEKYDHRTWPIRLDASFALADFAIPGYSHWEALQDVTYLEPEAEIPARLVSVPKTPKTPRLIALEPTAMQYAQQAVLESLVRRLSDGRDFPLPWLIGFDNQDINRDLAQEGSFTGELATLDLSEASDRVSNQLVLEMTRWTPYLRDALQATRSRKVDVPGYGIQRIAKFASMGSAVCFPIEAMVFATLVLVGIQRQLNRRLRRNEMLLIMAQVRIYGDDIIVPVEYASTVAETLEDFGLRVNLDKSFWTGKFRESCGGDFYDGVGITPIRCRTQIPAQRRQTRELVSTVSFRNQCYLAGLWKTAGHLDEVLKRLIPLPNVTEKAGVLGRVSRLGFATQRQHPTLHHPLVKGCVIVGQPPPSEISGEGALMKFFLKRGDEPFQDKKHLIRAGRPEAVYTKLRWTTPY